MLDVVLSQTVGKKLLLSILKAVNSFTADVRCWATSCLWVFYIYSKHGLGIIDIRVLWSWTSPQCIPAQYSAVEHMRGLDNKEKVVVIPFFGISHLYVCLKYI